MSRPPSARVLGLAAIGLAAIGLVVIALPVGLTARTRGVSKSIVPEPPSPLEFRCPAVTRGAALVPLAEQGVCIDAHEATQQSYATFLREGPPPSDSPACAGKPSHAPPAPRDTAPLGCPAGAYDPAARPDAPVVCVDYCDAEAYCRWSGKRLCGRRGGGTIRGAEHRDAASDEWFAACSRQGSFPYGDTYRPGACADGSRLRAAIASKQTPVRPPAVTADTGCASAGPARLFGLSGSVHEWENACEKGVCRVRGGSFASDTPESLRCDADLQVPEGLISEEIGIRCCADPVPAPLH